MRIPRVYTPQILSSGQTFELEPQSSHHLGKVLRMKPDDPVILFNGDGNDYSAHITAINKKLLTVFVTSISAVETESPLTIHLGIGISKGDKMDWIIQKSTELGINSITPLFTERTETRIKGDRADKKLLHWQQISISACEQSGRSKLPKINSPCNIAEWAGSINAEKKFILHHRCTEKPGGAIKPGSVALLIGPEGGLSDTEIISAQQQNFQSLALGPRVLRTETAPLAAISVIQFLWGDF